MGLCFIFYFENGLSQRPTGSRGIFFDRRRWRKKGEENGEAVKTDSDGKERPSVLGTARGPSLVQVLPPQPKKNTSAVRLGYFSFTESDRRRTANP